MKTLIRIGDLTKSYVMKESLDYYINLKDFINEVKVFDSKLVPLVKYPYGIGIQYNAVTCCQFALGNLQLYLESNLKKFLNRFFLICKWLTKTSIKTKFGGKAWYYNFDNPYYRVKTPYLSCMSQGQAISVFIRAYNLTGNRFYLQMAKKSMKVLQKPIDVGGVLCNDTFGIWLEEVPTNPPSHILNGYIFALFGVYDLFLVTKEDEYKIFFDECVDTLRKAIHLFNNGYWSIYDLFYKYPSTLSYHDLHIWQLKALYRITDCKVFEVVSRKFENQKEKLVDHYRSTLTRNLLLARDVLRVWGLKSLGQRFANRLSSRLHPDTRLLTR